MKTERKLLWMFVFAFGGMLGVGALGEIVVALDPALLPPDALELPFMAAHQTSRALRCWMLVSNALNLACAVTLIRAAVSRPRGWRALRFATGTLAVIALLGIVVCLPYLLPLPTGRLHAPSQFMLISVVSASSGLATLCLVLCRAAHRQLGRNRANAA